MSRNCYIFPNWYVCPNWYSFFFKKLYQLGRMHCTWNVPRKSSPFCGHEKPCAGRISGILIGGVVFGSSLTVLALMAWRNSNRVDTDDDTIFEKEYFVTL